ncbi:MAG: aquaporin [Flavobacteriales bacterium]|nr:aquaporin [Flavobacteriales bacterium]
MNRFLAEYIGTFALVFCGTGAIITNQISGNAVTHVGIGLTFGLIVLVMIYALGHISGAHFNPAVSIGLWASGQFSARSLLPYIASQILGALTASVVLKAIFPYVKSLGETMPSGSAYQAAMLELLLTFFLMLVILQVSASSKRIRAFAGLAIGSTVMLEAIFAGPITGASMNPARSLGPAVVNNNLSHLWVYFAGPISGALLAVLSSRILEHKK